MLNETVFRSDDLPEGDRFDYWRQRMVQTLAPMEMSSDHQARFGAHMRLLDLGAVQVWPTTFSPMRFRRTPSLIRQSDPELYHVTLVQHGALGVSQAGREAVHRRHDLYVIDSSLPFDAYVANDRQTIRGIGVEIPKALLRLPGVGVGELLGHQMSGREGIGALLAQFLTRLAADSGSHQPSDGPQLGQVVLDLLSALLAHELRAEGCLAPETRQRGLMLRIRAYIEQHLHDPGLTPGTIAAAHHISLSYLHRLFSGDGDGVTVSAWIRGRRLERARRDLGDTALRHIPVHEIGARVGLNNPAVFSRVFRGAYGIPPGEYRHQTVRMASGESGRIVKRLWSRRQ
jgi:AraC-like DNA-binding protein